MFDSIKAKNNAIDILTNYSGKNPYLLRLKRDVILCRKTNLLSDYVVEYVIKNKDFEPQWIGKNVKIADWLGEKMQNDYNIEFTPQLVRIFTYLGETSYAYYCTIKYRQNMEPMEIFLPKKGVLGNFLIEDYHTVNVDFDRYDNLSMLKDPDRKLKNHQKEAIQFLLHRKKCILADDMGLGKTTELSVAAIEGNFDSVLIICPASLKNQWKNELMWYVTDKDVSIIDGVNDKTKPELEKILGYGIGKSGLKREQLLEEAKNRGKWENNRFVIVNYDILDEFYKIPKTRSAENIKIAYENSPMLQYVTNRKTLLIIDEAHRLSNSDSDRYKIINDLIKRGKPHSIYLATGTPITNNPSNFYCLLKLLSEDITLDWNYYMERYCGAMKIPAKGEKEKWSKFFFEKKKRDYEKEGKVAPTCWGELTPKERDELKEYISANARKITILKDPTNLEELKLKISHIYLRRTKEDIADGLPNKNVHELLYDFDMVQEFEYARLWEEYEAAQLELDPTKEINKDLLEGAVYRKYCSNQMIPNTIKLADEFIKNGEKVIISTCFDEELYALKDYYGDKCVVFNGKMTPKQKETSKEAFLTDPTKMVFIGQIIAAGVGLNLVVSHRLIFNDIDYVPGNNRQMEDRVYRIGQKHDVDIYYQIFRGTQYEKMWNTVIKKELAINQVIKKEDEK